MLPIETISLKNQKPSPKKNKLFSAISGSWKIQLDKRKLKKAEIIEIQKNSFAKFE